MQFKLIYCILMTFLPPLRGSLLIILRFTGAALAALRLTPRAIWLWCLITAHSNDTIAKHGEANH